MDQNEEINQVRQWKKDSEALTNARYYPPARPETRLYFAVYGHPHTLY